MGNWNFLGGVLEEVHLHSTAIGKIWLTLLFIFRMLVLGVAAEEVWSDEQSGFICNTEQPGCRNVCYDQAFPISLVRYWILQVIFVSSPSLVYMGHALYRLKVLEKERRRKKARLRAALKGLAYEMPGDRGRLEQELCQLERRKLSKAPLRGTLLCTYVIHILARSAVEVGFMMGQYLLYGFHLEPLFKCRSRPCPNIIDCFVSRPTEKTIFLFFMQCIAAVSLFLNILEIFHLGFKKIKRGLWGQHKWKDEHEEFFANKSKHNLAKHQSPSANSLSSAPDDYLLLEKQTRTAACPRLNSPAFPADPDHRSGNDEKRILDEQGTVLSNEMCTLSATCSHLQPIGPCNDEDAHKILRKEVGNPLKEKRDTDGKDRKRNHYSRGHCSIPGVAGDPDNHVGQSLQTVFFLPANCAWKQTWLSATCGPPTEGENRASPPKGNLKGQFREGTIRTLPPSRGDCQPLDIPDTPDSLGQWSFESDLIRSGNNPAARPPKQLALLTNNLVGRRAPTDLQI